MSDRLIPSRGTCGAVGQLKLTKDENWAPENEYQEVLSQNVLGRGLASSKVLSYKHKPQRQDPDKNEFRVQLACSREGASRSRPSTHRAVPPNPVKVLDAPGIVDDFYSHPVDWSARNVVAVALSESVYLFNTQSGHTEKLLALPAGNVTTLRWSGEGAHLSVGTTSSEVQIWDCCARRQLRSLRGHGGRIGALAWHEHVLSSGSADKEVHHHDVRVREHLFGRLAGAHTDLVCGLDYSPDGVLASGGNDNAVCIWQSAAARIPCHTLSEHRAAVKAVRWCPWQRHVLATGGGTADRRVCLWNASSGRLLASADAQSQVTGVAWGLGPERELLTAHGYSRNQLSLWRHPSLAKVADLEGHGARLLGIAQSPDGSLVCSSSADETLRFWRLLPPAAAARPDALGQGRCRGAGPSPILRTIR